MAATWIVIPGGGISLPPDYKWTTSGHWFAFVKTGDPKGDSRTESPKYDPAPNRPDVL